VKGERLYTKARRGEEIVVPPRAVKVYDFKLKLSSQNRLIALKRIIQKFSIDISDPHLVSVFRCCVQYTVLLCSSLSIKS